MLFEFNFCAVWDVHTRFKNRLIRLEHFISHKHCFSNPNPNCVFQILLYLSPQGGRVTQTDADINNAFDALAGKGFGVR